LVGVNIASVKEEEVFRGVQGDGRQGKAVEESGVVGIGWPVVGSKLRPEEMVQGLQRTGELGTTTKGSCVH